MKIDLIPLTPSDVDTETLKQIHAAPSVAKYISISDNYFNYVTTANGVVYHKIMADGILVGGLHSEITGETVYLSICVSEEYRRRGIAETALKQLIGSFPDEIKIIEVSIDETDEASVCLFEKSGFTEVGKEDELIIYRYSLHGQSAYDKE